MPKIGSVAPYTPLELMGRDIYLKEGCYNCHSQMVRRMRAETERYGEYSALTFVVWLQSDIDRAIENAFSESGRRTGDGT